MDPIQRLIMKQALEEYAARMPNAPPSFEDRFYGEPTAMHVPEYRVIGGQGFPPSQAATENLSSWSPEHRAMLIPPMGSVPDPNARPGAPDPNAPWGGGGYENKTPLNVPSPTGGSPPPLDPEMFPGLEDFLSPG